MNDAALEKAYNHIEEGDLEAARNILDDVQEQNKNNVDYWWIYAHAQEDEDAGKAAIKKLLELNPRYIPAKNLSEQMGVGQAPEMTAFQTSDQELKRDFERDIPEEELAASDWETPSFDKGKEQATPASSNFSRTLIGAALFVVIVGGIAFALLGRGQDDIPVTVTQNTEIAATSEPATLESIVSALATFDVPTDGIETTTTQLGDTLNIRTCAEPGTAASNAISGIADTLANNMEAIPETSEAVSFTIVNCTDDTIIRRVGFSIDLLNRYANEEITLADLQSQLRPIR